MVGLAIAKRVRRCDRQMLEKLDRRWVSPYYTQGEKNCSTAGVEYTVVNI